MLSYYELNVNPKNRKTGDCSTRALVAALEITYEAALLEQVEMALKKYYDITSKQTVGKVLENHGYVKMKMPKKQNGKRYKVYELDEILTKQQMEEGVVVLVANHWTCIKHGMVQDIWDCRNKSVGNYWVKEKKDESV